MNKVLMIGLDGATWDNLLPWIKQGSLPLLKQLYEEGNKGIIESTIPSLTCPALPSFYTGTDPSVHKAFSFRNNEGNIIRSQDIIGERFWDELSNKGIKCFISGVVTTYPAFIQGNNSLLLADPFLSSSKEYFIYPDNYRKEFEKNYFTPPLNRKEQLKWQRNDRDKLLESYLRDEGKRFDTIKKHLRNNDYDFILLYFISLDRIQHLLWNSQMHVLKAYQAIERWIKKLLRMFPDYKILIFSDHGFGKSPDKAIRINTLLENKGLLYYKNSLVKVKDYFHKKIYYGAGWLMEKYLPIKEYENIRKKLVEQSEKKTLFIEPGITRKEIINVDKSIAYLEQKWGLRVIKKEETNKIIDELEKTGLFTLIKKKEELYLNPIDEIPDIIFVVKPEYEVRTGPGKTISKIKFHRRQEGGHDNQRQGIIITKGIIINEVVKITELAGMIKKEYEAN